MKLKFDSSLDYQQEAVIAVADVFRGQTAKQSLFTVGSSNQVRLAFDQKGIGNFLNVLPEDILTNIREIQLRNGLKQSTSLGKKLNLDMEMETGTGKTYVYLRTILELNKRYGFTKFIIVVPSIAIKEGVNKTVDITREHFASLFNNVNYDAYIYDSSHIEKIRDFATSSSIQIMIMTIDAFNKTSNVINNYNDKKFGEDLPIELIRETHPIVIIDEPQSTISTDAQVEAVESLNPLCTIRYSATPVRVENMLYRLDAVDSFNKKLVKGIEVDSFATSNDHNEAYLLLKSVDNKKTPIKARIEMDVQNRNGSVQRKTVTVKQGDDLYEKSGGRDVYEGYIIKDICCSEGNEAVDFTSRPDVLYLGKAIGSFNEDVIKKEQIKATIEEHLDKELILNPKGIKVLSLFFIDKVANYREYDEDGNKIKGKYAQWFEEIYQEVIRKPKYHDLFNSLHDENDEADLVHNGYFSADKPKKNEKEGRWKDTGGSSAADDDTYNLIMKEKERLLSFDNKVRFIWSHSALKEGWDNPNVFQICTLNETKSTTKKRQEIGRGLRLCVNQQGERQYDPSLNILTVMANESYDEFASNLQREYEEDGIRFGVLDVAKISSIIIEKKSDGENEYLGTEKAEMLMDNLLENDYIDNQGNVQKNLKADILEGNFSLPEELEKYRPAIEEVCKRTCNKVPIHNKRDRKTVKLNKEIYISKDFKALWDKVKWKTTYRVNFSTDELLEKCRKQMATELIIPSAKIVKTTAGIQMGEGGVNATLLNEDKTAISNYSKRLPDIITYLQGKTNLTRRTIVEILTGKKQDESGKWVRFDDYGNRLDLFQKNPQLFMEKTAKIIRSVMESLIVDGIRYQRIGDDEYYCQELFEQEELEGYFESNMLESHKGIYDYVIYDSDNERKFAEAFEKNGNVILYAKLPDWFKIDTPLGSYNPDWVLLAKEGEEKKLYFVLETKGNVDSKALRPQEKEKIECGKAHFEALGGGLTFEAIDFKTYDEGLF